MASKFDYDRGIMLKKHPSTHMYVGMYFDAPGVYLDAHGHELPEDMAAEAGFEVEKYRKARLKRERMKDFEAAVSAELDMESDEAEEEVLKQAGEFKLVKGALGRVSIFDTEGNKINTIPLTEEEGRRLLERLVPAGSDQKVKEKDKKNGSASS